MKAIVEHWYVTLAIVVAASLVWAAYPRNPSLIAFDPKAMADIETGLWKAYYEKDYLTLFRGLYRLSRHESGFSPLDSLRIAVSAARAARAFQPTTSRQEAEQAIPYLETYFRLLAQATTNPFSVEEAARLELDWWQARRENALPRTYGLTIAKVSTLLYGKDNERLRTAGVLRAEAMAYRDARKGAVTEADWQAISTELSASYQMLKDGIVSPSVQE